MNKIVEKINDWYKDFSKNKLNAKFDFTAEEIEKWYEFVVKEQNEVSFQEALNQGRLVARTFEKDALFKNTSTTQTKLNGIEALVAKFFYDDHLHKTIPNGITNAIKKGLASSVLPSKLYNYEESEGYYPSIGIAFVNIKQEDNAFYHFITDKSIIKRHPELQNVIKKVKDNLSRISYFDNYDINSGYDKNKSKVIPAFNVEETKLNASSFQGTDNFDRLKELTNFHNEAIVKMRPSLKRIWFFAPSEEYLDEIKSWKLEEFLFKDIPMKVEYIIVKQNIENSATPEQRIHLEDKIFDWNSKTNVYDESRNNNQVTPKETNITGKLNSRHR